MVSNQSVTTWWAWLGALMSVVCLLLAPRANAFEQPVHKFLAEQAIDYLVARKPALASCSHPAIRDALGIGAKDEDGPESSLPSLPIGPFYFHFAPKLVDDITLLTPIFPVPITTAHVRASCNIYDWAFGVGTCGALISATLLVPPGLISWSVPYSNLFTWGGVETRLSNSTFKEDSDSDRETALKGLGHILHLLQDLAQPAHVRNDAHPHFPFPNLFGLRFGDPSQLEVLSKEQLANDPVAFETRFATFLEAFRLHPPDAVVTVGGSPRELAMLIDGDGLIATSALGNHPTAVIINLFQLLQEFTSQYFYSDSTIGHTPTPAEGTCLSTLPPLPAGTVCNHEGRPLYVQSVLWGKRITPTVAQAQFDVLGPAAAVFGASLINHIHENITAICRNTLTVNILGHGQVIVQLPAPESDLLTCDGPTSILGPPSCRYGIRTDGDVTFTAIPAPGFSFTGWGDDCSGTSTSTQVTMSDDKDCTAIFEGGPSITSFTATPPSVPVSGQSTISVQASDPDNEPLTYAWAATCGTLSSTTGPGDKAWTAPASLGTCTVSVTVTDPFGASDTASVDISVLPLSIMTFESLAWSSGTGAYGFPDGYYYLASAYTESGFTISPGGGFCVIAQDNPNLFMGSTGLANCNANGINTLTKVGGGTFSLSSIDLAPFGRFLDPVSPYGGGASVPFVGTKANGSKVFATFTAPPDAPPFPAYWFQTYSFSGLGFDDLVSVSWTHIYPYHQFDNIKLQ